MSKILEQETVYKGRIFTLKRAKVKLPDERIVEYDLIAHHGAVTLVPIDEDGNIYFVRQYRVAADREILELPAGTLEEGEPPEECARREIREETGMAAREFIKLGEMYMVPGYSSEYMYNYASSRLIAVYQQHSN